MFLKKIDFLSPPITLYYKGEKSHPSIFSGLLTFVAYVIIFVFGVYYALEFINKESPTAYFFNKYVENAGVYPVNASSMFNFIQMYSTKSDNSAIPTEFDKVEIIGIEETIDNFINNTDLTKYNHWLYGPCNNDTDTEGISYLIDVDYFTESACIRKYYNKDTQKYYDTNDDNFKWPVILYGCSHPDRTFYGILMKKCENTDLRLKTSGSCAPQDEIEKYLEHTSINFRIIDHYADVLNYRTPFTKYLYAITSGIFNNSYTINHLNFNPALMQTHNGIFFDNIVETPAYFFTQNEKITSEGKTSIFGGFYFWMQNVQQYYERHYKRLQDILSDIGGIGSIVLMAAEAINYLVVNYIILLDTEELVLKADESNFKKKGLIRKPTIYRKANQIMVPPRKQRKDYNNDDLNDSQQSSNYQKMLKDGVNIVKKKNINNEEGKNNKLYMKKNKSLSKYLKKKSNIKKDNTFDQNNDEREEKEKENNDIYRKEEIENNEDSYDFPGLNEFQEKYELKNNMKNNNLKEESSKQENSKEEYSKEGNSQEDYSKEEYPKEGYSQEDYSKEDYYKKEKMEQNQKEITKYINKNKNDKYKTINLEGKNMNSERAQISEEPLKINNNNNYSKKYNNYKNIIKQKNILNDKSNQFKAFENRYSVTKRKNEEDDNSYKLIEKQQFNWFKYLGYMICCKRNNLKIQYYEDFRAQIISEESLIQNHLNVYRLLKVCKIENPPNLLNKLKGE